MSDEILSWKVVVLILGGLAIFLSPFAIHGFEAKKTDCNTLEELKEELD